MTGITENCRLLRRMKKYLVSHILTTEKKKGLEKSLFTAQAFIAHHGSWLLCFARNSCLLGLVVWWY